MTDPQWAPILGAVTLVVDDLVPAEAFYRTAFDVEPIFADADSVVFRFGTTMINLLVRRAAGELLAPAGVGASSDDARVVFTVAVPDTDAYCALLVARGVTLLNGPVTRPWGPRTASFADPDGHVWEIAS